VTRARTTRNVDPEGAPTPGDEPAGRGLGGGRLAAVFAPSSPTPVIVGVVVVAVGFGLIAVGWAKVAGLTDVGLQLPYLVSAGLTGLALVMVGLLIINLAVRNRDAAEHRRLLEALTEAVGELRDRRR